LEPLEGFDRAAIRAQPGAVVIEHGALVRRQLHGAAIMIPRAGDLAPPVGDNRPYGVGRRRARVLLQRLVGERARLVDPTGSKRGLGLLQRLAGTVLAIIGADVQFRCGAVEVAPPEVGFYEGESVAA